MFSSLSFSQSSFSVNSFLFDNAVEPPVTAPSSGGGRILVPSLYAEDIKLEGIKSGSFQLNINKEPVSEASNSYTREIDRFKRATDLLTIQIEAAKLEINLYNDKSREALIRLDLILIYKFIKDLLIQIELLKLIRKRRIEEEEITLILTSIYI